MTCASCVRRVETALDKVDGVRGATVNLATEKATVSFDPARVRIESLTGAVEAAGYTATLPAPTVVVSSPASEGLSAAEREDNERQHRRDA